MSTKAEGTGASGGDLPETTGSSGKLNIQMLVRGGDDMSIEGSKIFNLLLCFIALCFLYGFYIAFGLAWMTAMTELGEDLNWAFFGAMISVGGGMMGGVAYSMKAQQVGWWEQLSPGDARRDRDPRGKCCGFQIY